MFKLRKNPSILVLLREREIHSGSLSQKIGCNILSRVIRWENATFAETWRHACRKPVFCEEDKLFLHNHSDCFSLWGTSNIPYPLYDHNTRVKSERVVDVLTCAQRYPSSVNPEDPLTYQKTLIVLFEDNWLELYNHETGKLVRSIFLGNRVGYFRFKHCDWDVYPTQFTVNWIHRRLYTRNNSSADDNRLNERRNRFSVIAVFSFFPLEFRAMMAINNSAFGKNISRVNVCDGTLIIGSGLVRHGTIELYNFEEIIEKNLLFTAKLGEQCKNFCGRVGHYPGGLPMNCVITKLPPVLFSIDCADFCVKFGFNPYHYAIKLPNSTLFQIRRLSDDEEPESLCIEPSSMDSENNPYKNDDFQFHFDDSNRIIHRRAFDIVMYKYFPETSSVEKLFTLEFQSKQRPKINLSNNTWEDYVEDPKFSSVENCVICFDYEHELDLIAVLGFNYYDASCKGLVKIFDNDTGALVKSFDTNLNIDDDDIGYGLVFRLDTIVVAEGQRYPRSMCVVYKLCFSGCSVPSRKYLRC